MTVNKWFSLEDCSKHPFGTSYIDFICNFLPGLGDCCVIGYGVKLLT